MSTYYQLNKICPICGSSLDFCFSHQVLDKYFAKYYFCKTCGYLKADDPFWLDQAYSSAISKADTGILIRNLSLLPKVASILYWLFNERGEGRYLDIAGGYGILTRLMRDIGFDCYWNDKYCQNLFARGFEYTSELGCCKAVIAIEVMEHLVDPLTFMKETIAMSSAETIIFTTELFSGDSPPPISWWYYVFKTGQHISFFQAKTLAKLASLLNMNFYSSNGIHMFTRKNLNRLAFHFLTTRFISLASFLIIKKLMHSRTLPDHYLMLND
ncbi:class I SAM-dependent methyltransferase [Thermosynechococcus sp. B0]|uniref:class I SAM-dependent methyltransferase n=1 Tax=Thermosynechococcus sp. B0 TaxID=2937284 RepID=UPI002578B4A4|nr:class I SAM-dependent methyltransferase [Thermosynechococcus sp. B0]WJI24231.1 class I SAM-dependent methyltransferase [Thermosynechococcus sp. B0]